MKLMLGQRFTRHTSVLNEMRAMSGRCKNQSWLSKEKSATADVSIREAETPMQPDIDAQKAAGTPPDRRRHPRYRFSVPITIRSSDGAVMPGISIEISASGISAIAPDSLKL